MQLLWGTIYFFSSAIILFSTVKLGLVSNVWHLNAGSKLRSLKWECFIFCIGCLYSCLLFQAIESTKNVHVVLFLQYFWAVSKFKKALVRDLFPRCSSNSCPQLEKLVWRGFGIRIRKEKAVWGWKYFLKTASWGGTYIYTLLRCTSSYWQIPVFCIEILPCFDKFCFTCF